MYEMNTNLCAIEGWSESVKVTLLGESEDTDEGLIRNSTHD